MFEWLNIILATSLKEGYANGGHGVSGLWFRGCKSRVNYIFKQYTSQMNMYVLCSLAVY